MASRDPLDLSPAMRDLYHKHMEALSNDILLRSRGVHVFLTCTYRSAEEQAELYAHGRTAPGPIVTNAKPGQSKHNAVDVFDHPSAEAYDVAILENGKLVWDDHPAWQIIGQHGMAVGLKWYGAPGAPFKEMPHFQNPEA